MRAEEVRAPGQSSSLDWGLFSTLVLSCLAYSVFMTAAGENSTAGTVGLVALPVAALCAYLLERRARPGNRLGRVVMIFLAMAFVYRFGRDLWIETGVAYWLRR
jgi:hypothetical protein